MKSKIKAINLHKKMTLANHFERGLNLSKKYDIDAEHAIEYNDECVIITAAVKIDRNHPDLDRILKQMEEKQESPVVTFIKKLERTNKNEIKSNENDVRPMYDKIMLL